MELTTKEQEDLRSVLTSFFGAQTVSSWTMNDKVLEAARGMLNEVRSCSDAMDFVPRPGLPDAGYFRRQLRDIARRVGGGGNNYEICKNVGAIKWKRTIEYASMGL